MGEKKKNNRLRKHEILRRKDCFKKIFGLGSKISMPNVSMIYLPADSRKIGFVVSKRIKKAVERNRYKRLLREIYRLNKEKFPENAHIILFAKGRSDDFWVLQDEIFQLLNNIHNI